MRVSTSEKQCRRPTPTPHAAQQLIPDVRTVRVQSPQQALEGGRVVRQARRTLAPPSSFRQLQVAATVSDAPATTERRAGRHQTPYVCGGSRRLSWSCCVMSRAFSEVATRVLRGLAHGGTLARVGTNRRVLTSADLATPQEACTVFRDLASRDYVVRREPATGRGEALRRDITEMPCPGLSGYLEATRYRVRLDRPCHATS